MRFRKSIKIAPGLRVNLSKKGLSSLSLGPRGSSVSIGGTGTYANIGLPGTGLSHRTKLSGGSASARRAKSRTPDGLTAKERKEMVISELQSIVDLENEAIEEGLNQHKKIVPVPDEYSYYTHISGPPEPSLPPLWPFIISVLGIYALVTGRSPTLSIFLIVTPIVIFACQYAWRHVTKIIPRRKILAELQAKSQTYKAMFDEVLKGDLNAAERWLEIIFDQLDWFLETTVNFELTPDGKTVAIDVDLPEIEDIPDQTSYVKKTTQTIESKDRKAIDINNDYLLLVHSTVLRLAGEVFCQLPEVKTAVISGYTQRTDKTTGLIKDDYVVTAIFDKNKWRKLNPASADPINCLGHFRHRRDINKNKLLGTIEPFTLTDAEANVS